MRDNVNTNHICTYVLHYDTQSKANCPGEDLENPVTINDDSWENCAGVVNDHM